MHGRLLENDGVLSPSLHGLRRFVDWGAWKVGQTQRHLLFNLILFGGGIAGLAWTLGLIVLNQISGVRIFLAHKYATTSSRTAIDNMIWPTKVVKSRSVLMGSRKK